MRNKLVILAALAMAGFMLILLLADRGSVPRKVRAQRAQGVNIVPKVSFTLNTTNAPVLVPTKPKKRASQVGPDELGEGR